MKPMGSQDWRPHQYQLHAVEHLLMKGGAGLFLDPGLGKTSIVLAGLAVCKLQKSGPALVVAPLRPVYHVWPNEVKKWTEFNGLKVVILHGPDKAARLREKADIYLINYEGLQWLDEVDGFTKLGCDTLILDESTKVKNSQSKRFKILRKHLNKFRRRWILTGTPVPNGLIDIWSQVFICDAGLSLGRFISHFRAQYFHPSGYGGYDWQLNHGAAEQIYSAIKPYILQMSAEDYLEMPELVSLRIVVDMPPPARQAYTAMEENFLLALGDQPIIAPNAAAAGVKCRQIANGALYTDGSGSPVQEFHTAKLDALEDLVDELAGSPVLIVYEFVHDKTRIMERLKDRAVALADLSEARAAEAIDAFNRGDLPALVVHPLSAGHGLNLQGAAAHVAFFGITWDLEAYDQVLARVYRQGNPNKRVFLHHIVAENTLDERVMKTLELKDRTQQALLRALRD